VDEYSRSSVPHIHAVGDCTDRLALTPVAIREGQALADTLFGGKPTPVDHRCVPTAVFSLPPLASVGLTEEEARRAHRSVDIYRAQFRPLRHTLSGRRQRVLMKLVVDGTSERILGAHMIGSDAPEIIQCMAIALRMGARKSDLDATTALHPTTAEEFVLMRQKQPARQL
jgi:glutathione reductase (NADPH)